MRYVVLHHTGIDQPHFDILVEMNARDALWTWRSPAWPVHEPTEIQRLRDHRRLYLDYEGTIAGDRGDVVRVGEGTSVADGRVIRLDERFRIDPDGDWWWIRPIE